MDLSRLAAFDYYKLASPLVAILLLLLANTTGRWLTDPMAKFIDAEVDAARVQQPTYYRSTLLDIAADGAARVSFFSATLASFASLASLFSAGRTYQWWGLLVLVSGIVFVMMLAWVLTDAPGNSARQAVGRLPMTGTQLCRVVLLVWNIALLILILVLGLTPVPAAT